MEKNRLKKKSCQEVSSSSEDVNILITSMFFLVKICDDLQPAEVKKDFAIMKKIAVQPEKVTQNDILYAEKCMDKWDKILKKFQRKIDGYQAVTEIFRWLEERSRSKMKGDSGVG